MYTSGWPKNQNRCCQRIGDPPLMKKLVPKFRSSRSMTTAEPSRGNANRISPDWVRTVHEKMSRLAHETFSPRSPKMVAMKLIAPIVAETPVRWRPRSIRSTPALAWLPDPTPADSGVYIVQPVWAGMTSGTGRKPAQMSRAPGGRSQNAMALIRGNAMSSAPISSGTK
jgi:hypothetical protein